MLKIKNTKHLDTAEEIFTEFLDKFQKYAAEAAEISKGAPPGYGALRALQAGRLQHEI